MVPARERRLPRAAGRPRRRLVQLFPAAAYGKNGADIRLAVDAIEDMFRLPDLTHIVIVAGDSDYIALAQRAKRLGRYVVAVGCCGVDEQVAGRGVRPMLSYDALAGVAPVEAIDDAPDVTSEAPTKPATRRRRPPRLVPTRRPPQRSPRQRRRPRTWRRSSRRLGSNRACRGAGGGREDSPRKAARLTDSRPRLGRAPASCCSVPSARARQRRGGRVARRVRGEEPASAHGPGVQREGAGYASFSDFADSFKFVEVDATQRTRRLRLRRR